MDLTASPFEHDYQPGNILFGRGCVSKLAGELERHGASRAMVVCGSNVGANSRVMEPIRQGLGDRFGVVYDGTTPNKYVGAVYDGVEIMREHDIDALVSVGGGSSLDTAHVMNAFASEGKPIDRLFSRIGEDGSVVTAEITGEIPPLFVVPTTLAGADLSIGGGVKLTPEPQGPSADQVYGSVTSTKLMPKAVFYDPDLFETTPRNVLIGSAMNGFNKGIEMLYSRNANPITDGSAIHGLRMLRPALPHLSDDSIAPEVMDQIVAGIILVQYGLSPSEDGNKLSIIHAFGHGFSQHYEAHQGVVHAITAPPVLAYLFETVDACRDRIAEALGILIGELDDEATAEAVVEDVAKLRDDLGLPSRLRALEGVESKHLPEIAVSIAEDRGLNNCPVDVHLSVSDIEAILDDAW